MKIKYLLLGIYCILICSIHVSAKEKEFISDELLQQYTEEIGELYNLSPYLLQAICEKESTKNINAQNGQCKGLMQISEKWHKERMEKLGVEDLFDPYGNILVAADFLSELSQINEDTAYILMRYNMKKNTAEELYKKGSISKYAKSIIKRAEELENIEKQKQEKIEALMQLNYQKYKESLLEDLPICGVEIWIS